MITFQYNGKDVEIRRGQYEGGGIALRVYGNDGQPLATLTINVIHAVVGVDEFVVKTYSENAGVAVAAWESGLFIDTGKRIKAGYVTVPVWKFADGILEKVEMI